MRTASLTYEKKGGFYQSKATFSSLSFKDQAIKHKTVNWSIVHNSSAKT